MPQPRILCCSGRHGDGRINYRTIGRCEHCWFEADGRASSPKTGIIPVTHQQDTAGPMARTVTDVAILLGVLQSPFGSVAGRSLPRDYTQFLRRGALKGAYRT